jgi:hypothetical protein
MPRTFSDEHPPAPDCAIHHEPLEYAGTFDGEHSYECRLHTRNGPCSVTQWIPISKDQPNYEKP